MLDANVWVSATLFPSSIPAQVVTAIAKPPFLVLTSEELIDQTRRTLLGPKFALAERFVDETERRMRDEALVIEPDIRLSVITAKDSDNRVLECAVTGEADYIVTGDRKHLLRLGSYAGIPLLSPREFVETFRLTEPDRT